MNTIVNSDVVVLGAGAIGICSALELIKSGKSVVLIDRDDPGSNTSMGNAGVLNRGSLIPFNNPDLIKNLPALITKRQTGFDYRFAYLFNEMNWGLRFLSHCTEKDTSKRASALNTLISRSAILYRNMAISDLLRGGGWLKLFHGDLPKNDSFEITTLQANEVLFETLNKNEIHDLEPALMGFSGKALWIKDTASLKDPQKMVQSLAKQFIAAGGKIIKDAIRDLHRENGQWFVKLSNGEGVLSEHALVALGPWSRVFLEKLNLFLPMVYERGAHREFNEGAVPLTRPIHDVNGGYVLSPLENRWRVTCGVELAPMDAPRTSNQMDAACRAMKKIIAPGKAQNKPDWLGARPTLPDSLPAIGETKISNLWLATGHQHIGMATAPATGELIANLINDQKTQIDSSPFSPNRFGL